jgi:dissimilatory sulfite reductase (desulfoviridin) alpha/beta subunit
MSRTPARVTQADVARAIRAAQQCGAGQVKITKDGEILIDPIPQKQRGQAKEDIAPKRRIVL